MKKIQSLQYIIFFSWIFCFSLSLYGYDAPYSNKKFHSVLDHSKLQYPKSSRRVSYAQFEGFAQPYFYLDENQNMTFTIGKISSDGKTRVELRQGPNEWKTSTKTSKKMIGIVKCFTSQTLSEYTWMQIHDSTSFNKPLLRLVWRKIRKNKQDHLWAVIRSSLEKKYKWYDLGKRGEQFFKAEIAVKENQLKVKIDNKTKVQFDVSYWENLSSYFKVGLYLNIPNDTGEAKVQFKEIDYHL